MLWILQVLLGLAFIAIGGMKLTADLGELAKQGMTLATESPGLLRFIGLSELLGGLGLILPAATRIKPILTPIAAAALTLVMVLAVGYHVVIEGQPSHSGSSFVFGVLCALVAYGRFSKATIAAR